jgi:hypothetical protein
LHHDHQQLTLLLLLLLLLFLLYFVFAFFSFLVLFFVCLALCVLFSDERPSYILFTSGTDEHGMKVEQSAAKLAAIASSSSSAVSSSPQAYADSISSKFKDLLTTLNISNDAFIRTTDERHKASVVALWNKVRTASKNCLLLCPFYEMMQRAARQICNFVQRPGTLLSFFAFL